MIRRIAQKAHQQRAEPKEEVRQTKREERSKVGYLGPGRRGNVRNNERSCS